MKAIIIGAGRGRRMMPLTADRPKCLLEVAGRRVLDATLAALRAAGVDRFVFVGGYRLDRVRAAYPSLRFYENPAWERTNILASLCCAAPEMDEEAVITYSDILFRPSAARRLARSRAGAAVVVDQGWRARYVGRTEHPISEAEKVVLQGGAVARIGKGLPAEEAHGEFLGLARFDAATLRAVRDRYEELRATRPARPFHEAATLDRAYLTDMLQELIDGGLRVEPVLIDGGWHELDTVQDLETAAKTTDWAAWDGA